MEDTSAARYRAERQLDSVGEIASWAGTDVTLGRPVTVRVIEPATEVFSRMRSQVRALARLEHPTLLHVLDTCPNGDGFAVITEPIPQRRLTDELDDTGRLSVPRAVDVVRQVGSALAALHDAGFAHGGVTAGQIGVRDDHTVVLIDGPPTADAVSIPATPSSDLLALGQLLHRLVVGADPRTELDGSLAVHPAVPVSVHTVIDRALAADPTRRWPDVSAFVRALPAADDSLDAAPTPHASWRSERAWFAPVAVVLLVAAALVGVTAVLRSTEVGRDLVTSAKDAVGLVTDSTTSTVPPTTAPTINDRTLPLEVVAITDFDPGGDDRAERPERIEFINNGDLAVGWQTERYTSADFGNLKSGVGLIVELGPPQALDEVTVRSPSLDWGVDIYVANAAPGAVDDWGPVIASERGIDGSARIRLDGAEGSTILVWIVDLGEELPSGGHRVTVTDIEVRGRPVRG